MSLINYDNTCLTLTTSSLYIMRCSMCCMHAHTLQVRTALLNDMDTPAVVKLILELAAAVSRYIDTCIAQHKQPVPECIESSIHYIHRIMSTLGIDLSTAVHANVSNQSSDAKVVDCIVEFRKKLRQR